MSEFHVMLEAEIPRLRRYARALTRETVHADDLVQSCLVRAIAKQELWQPGTDLRAWLITMLHNLHITDVRRSLRYRETFSIAGAAPECRVEPDAFDVLELRDLEAAIGRLSDEHRQVILLIGLEEMPYEEAAAILGIPTGTLRSRLSRARAQLRILMDMGVKHRRKSSEAGGQDQWAA
jgi:RNA polymerase sigma-70 factor, ECF subfamily